MMPLGSFPRGYNDSEPSVDFYSRNQFLRSIQFLAQYLCHHRLLFYTILVEANAWPGDLH